MTFNYDLLLVSVVENFLRRALSRDFRASVRLALTLFRLGGAGLVLQLAMDKIGVDAIIDLEQLVVRAFFDNLSLAHDIDDICVADGGEAVRNADDSLQAGLNQMV